MSLFNVREVDQKFFNWRAPIESRLLNSSTGGAMALEVNCKQFKLKKSKRRVLKIWMPFNSYILQRG